MGGCTAVAGGGARCPRQRTAPFTLSAEIQRRLLPPAFTCEGGSFTLSAWLEPTASVGGETFDYSVARDHLRFSLTDAMGHGVDAALAATLTVGSLRGTRRRGGTIIEQAADANAALSMHGASISADIYVTGLLGVLDLGTGRLELVNAGHVAPYIVSASSPAARLELTADLPLGMFPDTHYHVSTVDLVVGDRLVLLTDGMTERNAAQLDIAAAIVATRDLHPREATQALADLVLQQAAGSLSDDATLMVLDWHGHHGTARTTESGVDPATASHHLPG